MQLQQAADGYQVRVLWVFMYEFLHGICFAHAGIADQRSGPARFLCGSQSVYYYLHLLGHHGLPKQFVYSHAYYVSQHHKPFILNLHRLITGTHHFPLAIHYTAQVAAVEAAFQRKIILAQFLFIHVADSCFPDFIFQR